MHIKEGLVYESKGAVWNNPLATFDIGDRGQLNNYGGGGRANKRSNAPRNRTTDPRSVKFSNAMQREQERLEAIWVSKFGPPQRRSPNSKKEKTTWEKDVTKFSSTHPIDGEIDVKDFRQSKSLGNAHQRRPCV